MNENVKIISYEPQYREIFKRLNEDWITAYFEMEEADYRILGNPEKYILQYGGHIFIALYNGEPVGACALIKMNDSNYDFELSKMVVDAKARGRHIGYLLGEAAINKAKELGAGKIFLESNTLLIPAINLYLKLGFKKIAERDTLYKRGNIQMELDINNKKMTVMKQIITRKEEAGKKVFKGVSLDVLSIADKSMVTKMNYVKGNFATTHSHPNEQSGYVISGKYRIIVDAPEGKIDMVLNPGDSYAIPGNYPHSFEVIERGEVIDFFTPVREDYL